MHSTLFAIYTLEKSGRITLRKGEKTLIFQCINEELNADWGEVSDGRWVSEKSKTFSMRSEQRAEFLQAKNSGWEVWQVSLHRDEGFPLLNIGEEVARKIKVQGNKYEVYGENEELLVLIPSQSAHYLFYEHGVLLEFPLP